MDNNFSSPLLRTRISYSTSLLSVFNNEKRQPLRKVVEMITAAARYFISHFVPTSKDIDHDLSHHSVWHPLGQFPYHKQQPTKKKSNYDNNNTIHQTGTIKIHYYNYYTYHHQTSNSNKWNFRNELNYATSYPNLVLGTVEWRAVIVSMFNYLRSIGIIDVAALYTPGVNLDYNDHVAAWEHATYISFILYVFFF
jgi:hypothetical protein